MEKDKVADIFLEEATFPTPICSAINSHKYMSSRMDISLQQTFVVTIWIVNET